MRLIDADKISSFGLTIAITESTSNVLTQHKRGKDEVIRRAVDVFNQALFQAPTIDPWHYPSKGEYPPKGKQVLAYAWNVHNVLAKYDTFDGKDIFVTFDAYNGFIEIKKVVRWQYIIPPQEEA